MPAHNALLCRLYHNPDAAMHAPWPDCSFSDAYYARAYSPMRVRYPPSYYRVSPFQGKRKATTPVPPATHMSSTESDKCSATIDSARAGGVCKVEQAEGAGDHSPFIMPMSLLGPPMGLYHMHMKLDLCLPRRHLTRGVSHARIFSNVNPFRVWLSWVSLRGTALPYRPNKKRWDTFPTTYPLTIPLCCPP